MPITISAPAIGLPGSGKSQLARRFTSDAPPVLRAELYEAWKQWGQEKRFANPVVMLTSWVRGALVEEGFSLGAGVADAFKVHESAHQLAIWAGSDAFHPDATSSFSADVALYLKETGEAVLSLAFRPALRGEPCGLSREIFRTYAVRASVPGITPDRWYEYALQAADKCFAPVSNTEPRCPLKLLMGIAMTDLRAQMSA